MQHPFYDEACVCGCDRGEHVTPERDDAGECHSCRDCHAYELAER